MMLLILLTKDILQKFRRKLLYFQYFNIMTNNIFEIMKRINQLCSYKNIIYDIR